MQNISIYINLVLIIELITCLNFGLSFDQLIEPKLKAGRFRDY